MRSLSANECGTGSYAEPVLLGAPRFFHFLLIFERFYGIIFLDLRRIVAPVFYCLQYHSQNFAVLWGPMCGLFYLSKGVIMQTPKFLRNLLQSNKYWNKNSPEFAKANEYLETLFPGQLQQDATGQYIEPKYAKQSIQRAKTRG